LILTEQEELHKTVETSATGENKKRGNQLLFAFARFGTSFNDSNKVKHKNKKL
jgi:hypothetical protein